MTGFDQKWEAIHKAREWGRYPDNHLVRFIMRNKELLGKDVLDIGCGFNDRAPNTWRSDRRIFDELKQKFGAGMLRKGQDDVR